VLDESFIRSLGLIVVFGTTGALLVRLIKLPMLVGFLLAGLFLGPISGLVEVSESLHLITEAGIILLLFLVGLELHIDKIKTVGIRALFVGLGQVLLTVIATFALCGLLGIQGKEALFLAIAITLSSTVVVVKMLADSGETQTTFGKTALAVLLIQDLVVVILLTLLSAFSEGGELTASAIAMKTGKAFASIGIVFVMVVACSRWVLPKAMGWASRSPNTLFIWSLCWCFIVVLVSHFFHLSHEIGAFLAGVSLAQLPVSHDLHRRVNPLMNLFLAVFFVTLGIDMNLADVGKIWGPALVLSLFVLLAKPLIVALLMGRLKFPQRTSFLTGVTLGQISEFSFILMALAVAGGFVTPETKGLTTFVGLITLSTSSCLITFKKPLLEAFSSKGILGWFGPDTKDAADQESEGLSGHIIIVGMNTLGHLIVHRLHEKKLKLLAVDTDPNKLKGLPPCSIFHGDISSSAAMEETCFSKASLVISTLHIEDTNALLAYYCRCHEIPCSIHAIDLSMVDDLLEMDPTYLMLPKVDGIKLQTRKLQEMGILP